jgi:hypothetical protein
MSINYDSTRSSSLRGSSSTVSSVQTAILLYNLVVVACARRAYQPAVGTVYSFIRFHSNSKPALRITISRRCQQGLELFERVHESWFASGCRRRLQKDKDSVGIVTRFACHVEAHRPDGLKGAVVHLEFKRNVMETTIGCLLIYDET